MSASRLDGWGWVFAVFGVGFLANALWMLAGHNHWWLDLPGVYFPAIYAPRFASRFFAAANSASVSPGGTFA